MEECGAVIIDETYEFSAPRFYDFSNGENEEEKMNAELWFETAISHAPSPVMPRIKIGRDAQINIDFSDADQMTRAVEESTRAAPNDIKQLKLNPEHNLKRELSSTEISGENRFHESLNQASGATIEEKSCKVPAGNRSVTKTASPDEIVNADEPTVTTQISELGTECNRSCCMHHPKTTSFKCKERPGALTLSKRQRTAKKIASLIKNPTSLKTKSQSQLSQAKSVKPASARREITQKKISTGTPNLAQENQAIKRQKLEGRESRKILNIKPQNLTHKSKRQKLEGRESRKLLNIKPQNLTHKSRPGLTTSTASFCNSTAKTRKEDRKVYVREPAAPFVSMAEMVKKFQSRTRDISLPKISVPYGKQAMLTLTRPKEPEFETAQRIRSTKVMTAAEIEAEMMAKMPKFKARRLSKKIFEASTLPPIPKSVPRMPEFQEFHLETMARASKNTDTSSVVSTDTSRQQNNQRMPHRAEPKTPLLQTSLRARPTNVKSSLEIEQEELEKIRKFKARPLNKKIFESKGDMELFCNNKKEVTVPQEFHFAID